MAASLKDTLHPDLVCGARHLIEIINHRFESHFKAWKGCELSSYIAEIEALQLNCCIVILAACYCYKKSVIVSL